MHMRMCEVYISVTFQAHSVLKKRDYCIRIVKYAMSEVQVVSHKDRKREIASQDTA